jgi:molybdopterin synthase catalytic subunit
MTRFEFRRTTIDGDVEKRSLADPAAGASVTFEGVVRNHQDGRQVRALDYEAYEQLGLQEGERIIAEALEKFPVTAARCIHRLGALSIGDVAVWVGVSAAHRDEAFAACRYIIDEVKRRVPIWKKEHYSAGDSAWVNCETGSAPSRPPS